MECRKCRGLMVQEWWADFRGPAGLALPELRVSAGSADPAQSGHRRCFEEGSARAQGRRQHRGQRARPADPLTQALSRTSEPVAASGPTLDSAF